MFGNKADKSRRLARLTQLIRDADGVTQAHLARELEVPRSTVYKDLATLEARGVLLAEDDGRLTFFGWRR